MSDDHRSTTTDEYPICLGCGRWYNTERGFQRHKEVCPQWIKLAAAREVHVEDKHDIDHLISSSTVCNISDERMLEDDSGSDHHVSEDLFSDKVKRLRMASRNFCSNLGCEVEFWSQIQDGGLEEYYHGCTILFGTHGDE